MAKLHCTVSFGTSFNSFTASAEVDVDDAAGRIGEKARGMFAELKAAAESAMAGYQGEVDKALEADKARRRAGKEPPRLAPAAAKQPPTGTTDKPDDGTPKCADCGAVVSNEKVVSYSQERFGAVVCFPCQEQRRDSKGSGTPF